jgi:hypothetical protein
LYGKYIAPKAEHIKVRISEISEGKFDKELKNLMKSDIKTLKKLYNERDIEPEESER